MMIVDTDVNTKDKHGLFNYTTDTFSMGCFNIF